MDENEVNDVLIEGEATPKRSKVIPLAAVLVVALAGGGFVGAKALGPALGSTLAARAETAPPKDKKKGGHGSEGGGEATEIHVVDNLVVNPASSGGSRFLLTSIAIEATDGDAAAELAARDVEIRDAFIMVLGTKTVDELTDISRRGVINGQLLKAVRELMGPDKVSRILIPQFVIQ